ncbi:MAG: hypothetical protein L6282_18540 [Candidatus Methanoperedenaceae archaeon]|nr:hypothetical protein [Candidatus Methanoperedenaceae archaeon]
MNRQAVIDILRKIFTFYGYEVTSSDGCDLFAGKESEHLFIKFDPIPNFNSIRHFSGIVQRYGGKGILISDLFDEKIRATALDDGLLLWDRSEIESRIGRAVLAGAFGQYGSEKAEIRGSEIQQTFQMQREPKKEYEKTIRIFLRSVTVNIGKSDALSIAEAKVGAVKSQKLKFIPVWFYRYSFNTQKKFKSRMVDLKGEGEGYVNAITGENYFGKCKDIQDNTFVPTQNYEIKQPVVEKKDALNKAVGAIIREHTKEVRLNEMIGDTIIFEQKVFAPEPVDITMETELIHFPVWELSGGRETIEINGFDGHILGVNVTNDAEFV